MQTYTQTYLDDDERWLLHRCAGIGIKVKDGDGRDYYVGTYLERMAEQRHNGVKQYETALHLIAEACVVLDPMCYVSYWQQFGVPHAELLAAERDLQVVDLLAAASICRAGLSLSSQPDPDPEDEE
jgi:hypothetical protein